LKVERKGFFSKKRGFEETLLSILLNVSSLHLVFLEKGVYETIHQNISKLSSKLFMGFYFGVCRESFFSASCIFGKRGL